MLVKASITRYIEHWRGGGRGRGREEGRKEGNCFFVFFPPHSRGKKINK